MKFIAYIFCCVAIAISSAFSGGTRDNLREEIVGWATILIIVLIIAAVSGIIAWNAKRKKKIKKQKKGYIEK